MARTAYAEKAAARTVAALFIATLSPGWAAAEPVQGTRIPVSVVEGRLVVRCDVSTRFRRLPVNLFVDYEATCGLELHNQAAGGLRSERGDGTAFPITVHLPGLDLTVERREVGDDLYLDHFTRWNSIALGEVSVVGTIGAKLLRDYHVVFDLDAAPAGVAAGPCHSGAVLAGIAYVWGEGPACGQLRDLKTPRRQRRQPAEGRDKHRLRP